MHDLASESGKTIALFGDEGTDPQPLLARAAVVVTGRSWPAVDAAVLGRPVVRTSVPLVPDAEVLESVAAALSGATDQETRRAGRGFPHRDGRCCARTFASIAELRPAGTS